MTIGELVKRSGLTHSRIRFYERIDLLQTVLTARASWCRQRSASVVLQRDQDLTFGVAAFEIRKRLLDVLEWKHAIDDDFEPCRIHERRQCFQVASAGPHEQIAVSGTRPPGTETGARARKPEQDCQAGAAAEILSGGRGFGKPGDADDCGARTDDRKRTRERVTPDQIESPVILAENGGTAICTSLALGAGTATSRSSVASGPPYAVRTNARIVTRPTLRQSSVATCWAVALADHGF